MRAFYEAMDRFTLSELTSGSTGEQVVRMHRMFLGENKAAGS
jgi:Rrf2 family nitric oxide-sensitive transcriptional repressor